MMLFDTQPTASPRIDLEMEAKRQREEQLISKFVSAITSQPASLIGKKPWEMTRSVWKSTIDPVKQAYDVSISVGEAAAKAYQDRYGFTHNGYDFQASCISNMRHEVQVAYALMRGDYVPVEVVNEYPKGYWETTYDLRELVHLPQFVVTAEDRTAAISCWIERRERTTYWLNNRENSFRSEAELKHLIVCYDRMLSELAHE